MGYRLPSIIYSQVRQTCVWIWVLSLTSCVTLNQKLFYSLQFLSVSRIIDTMLQDSGEDSRMHVESLAKDPIVRKCQLLLGANWILHFGIFRSWYVIFIWHSWLCTYLDFHFICDYFSLFKSLLCFLKLSCFLQVGVPLGYITDLCYSCYCTFAPSCLTSSQDDLWMVAPRLNVFYQTPLFNFGIICLPLDY